MNLRNKSILIAIGALSMISAIFLIPSQNAEATNLLSSVPNTLVAFWPADGNAKDVTGHGHNGVPSGNVVLGKGITGGAFVFHGVKGSVNVGSLGINNTTAPFSIVAWIKPAISNNISPTTIVQEGSEPNGIDNGKFYAELDLNPPVHPGTVDFAIGATQAFSQLKYTNMNFTQGKWTLVAATYDGSRTPAGMKIYINGTEQPTTSNGSGFTGTEIPRDQWSIGAQGYSSPPNFDSFNGSIDDIRVYSCSLSASDVLTLFHGSNVAKCSTTESNTITVGNGPASVALDPLNNLIYVANENDGTASVIKQSTNKVIATIPLGTFPFTAAVNPKTNTIYIDNAGDHTLSVINGSTNTVTSTLSTLGYARYGVAVNPSTNTVYVTSNTENLLYVLNGSTNTVTATVPVGNDASYDAVNPSTNTIYVSNYLDNTLSVINGHKNKVTATIHVGNAPSTVAVDPIRDIIYVTNSNDNTVSVINGHTNVINATITVGSGPQGIAVNPYTNTIYVCNHLGNTVSVIDGNTNTVTSTITVGSNPLGIAVNPNSHTVYVSNGGGNTVSVLK